MRLSFWDNMKFQWKIMLSFLVLLFLPVCVLAGYGYRQYVLQVRQETQQQISLAAADAREQAEGIFAGAERIARKIADNAILSRYFEDPILTDVDYVELQLQYINNLLNWVEELGYDELKMHFYTENPRVFENYYVSCVAGKRAPFFSTTLAAGYDTPYWEHGVVRQEKRYTILPDDGTSYTVYLPITNSLSGTDRTVVGVSVAYDVIFEKACGNEMFDWIAVDSGGQILFCSPGLEKEGFSVEGGALAFGSGRFLTHLVWNSPYDLAIYLVTPLSRVRSKETIVRNLFLACLAAAVSIMVCISFGISKNLAKRLEKLVEWMRAVPQTGLPEPEQAFPKDEIGALAAEFDSMVRKIDRLMEENYKAEILRKDAMVKALENQMNPHFLYNALETIRMMAEIRSEQEVADTVVSLGTIVRYNLSKGNESVSLREELEHIRSYCALYDLMMNGVLELHIDAPPETLRCRMLKLVLQPVVENSILHGFEGQPGACRIHLGVERDERELRVVVSDNGRGMGDEQRRLLEAHLEDGWQGKPRFETSGSGIALKNIHQRLRMKYGKEYGLSLESAEGVGTAVTIHLPVLCEDEE